MSQSTSRGPPGGALSRIAGLLDSDDLACHVVFVSRKKVASKVRRKEDRRHDFDLVGMNPRDRAYAELVGRCRAFVRERSEWRQIPLEVGDDGGEPPEGSYYVVNVENVPFYDEYLAEPAGDGKDKFDKKFISMIAAIQLRLTGDGGEAVFIRRFTPGKIFKRKKRTLFKFAEGDIDVEADDVVDLPEGYDCCIFGDHALIFNRAHYENMFDHYAIYEAVHKRVFAHFKKRSDFEIADIEKLEAQTLNDPAKLRRFPAILKRGIWEMQFARIEKFLGERAVTGVTATANPNRLAFENSRAMLHFLNDAHLDSKATGRPYLASTKTEE